MKILRNIGMMLLFALVACAFCIPAAALDAPTMQAEPQFTRGTSNVVFWTNIPAGATEVEVCQDANGDPADGCLSTQTITVSGTSGQATFAGTSGTTYYYYVRCKGDGNPWSNVVQSTQDDAGPTFSNAAPAGWTKETKPKISITVSDLSGIDSTTAIMTLDGTRIYPTFHAATQTFEASIWTALSEGTHAVVFEVKDNAAAPEGTTPSGNSGQQTYAFGVDIQAPQAPVSIETPGVTSDWNPPFSWTGATDAVSGVLGYEVILLEDDPVYGYYEVKFTPASFGADPFHWEVPSNYGFYDGYYEIRVWSLDYAGNRSESYTSAQFIIDLGDPTAPTDLAGPGGPTGDNTPEFTWSGATDGLGIAGYKIVITAGTETIQSHEVSFSADPMIWEVPENNPLSDGRYYVTICTKDVVGKFSPGRSLSFTVDTAPPKVPEVSAPSATTGPTVWLGLSSSDAGTGVHHFRVQVWHEGACVHEQTMPQSGNPSFYPDHDGAYEYRVWAVDGMGRESDSYGFATVIFDTMRPPDPVVIAESPTANPSPVFSITLPEDTGSGVSICRISWSGGFVEEKWNAGVHQWALPTPCATGGIVYIHVTSVDSAGNRSQDVLASAMIDLSPPSTPVFTLSTYYSKSPTPKVTWARAVDHLGISPIVGYKLGVYLDGAFIQDFFQVEDLEWTIPVGLLTQDGSYLIKVWAVDGVGHESAAPGECMLVLDRTPPPAPTITEYSAMSNFASRTVYWEKPTDVDIPVAGYRIEVWASGSCHHSASVSDAHTYASFLLVEGANEFRLWTLDAAGNESASFSSAVLVLDTAAPKDVSSFEVPGTTNDPTPVLKWAEVADDNSGVDSYEISVFSKVPVGPLTLVTSVKVTGIEWTLLPALADGDYLIIIRVIDKAGNASSGISKSMRVDTVLPSAPACINGPAVSSDTTPAFSWTAATDTATGVPLYRAEICADGVRVRGPFEISGTGWTLPDNSSLADGTYELRVWSVDGAGNTSTSYCAFAFRIDTAGPEVSLQISGPVQTHDTTPTFAWNLPAGQNDVSEFRVEVWMSGTRVKGPYAIASSPSVSWTVPETDALIGDGQYQIRVWCVDDVGNISISYSQALMTLDTIRPSPPTNVAGSKISQDLTPAFSWWGAYDGGTGISGYEVEIWLAGSILRGPVLVSKTTWEVSSDEPLTDGAYEIRIRAVDGTGLVSQSCATLAFALDACPPEPPASISGPALTNNTQPVFSWAAGTDSGSGISGYQIQICSGGVSVSQTWTVDPAARNAWVLPSGLTQDGMYEIHIWSVDTVGLVSAEYAMHTFHFDGTPPEPVTRVNGPALSNNGSPTFTWEGGSDTGSGLTGYFVWFVDKAGNPSFAQNVELASSSGWTVPFALTTGWHEIRVCSVDAAGNKSATAASFAFDIDTAPPIWPGILITSTDPTVATPTFEWSGASDFGTEVAGYRLAIVSGANVIYETAIAFAPDPVSWTLPSENALVDGTYEVRVWSVDLAGNISNSCAARPFEISGPLPIQPSSITGPSVTNSSMPSFEWSGASTLADPLVQYKVTVFKDASPLKTFMLAYAPDVYRWTVPAGTLSEDGLHSLRVWVIDAQGRQSANYAELAFRLDTGAPDPPASVTAPVRTSDTTPQISWSGASDSGSGLAFYRVEIWLGDSPTHGPYTVAISSDPVSWAVPVELPEGEYTVKVQSVDAAGNISPLCSNSNVFIIDTTPPTAPGAVSTPALTNNSRPGFSWGASTDPNGSVVRYRIEIRCGGLQIRGPFTATSSTWTLPGDQSPLASEAYELQISAMDDAGNTSPVTSFSFVVDTIAPSRPGTMSGPDVTANPRPSVNWVAATDNRPGTIAYRVELWQSGQRIGDPVLQSVLSWTPSEAGRLEDGQYELRVWAHDEAGNASATCGSLTFTVDTTPPAMPAVIVPAVVGTGTPELNWSGAADSGSGIASYTVEIWREGACVGGPVAVAAPAESLDWPTPLTDGAYLVRVRAIDKAGNASTPGEATFTIDAVLPAPAAISGPALTNTLQPEFNWDPVEDAAGTAATYRVELWQSTNKVAGPVTVASPNWAPTITTDGDYQIRVWSVSPAGQVSETYAFRGFRVDTTRPQTPAVTGPAFTNNSSPEFIVGASGDCTGFRLELWRDGARVSGPTIVPAESASAAWTPASPLTDGTYELRVWSRDDAGNESADSGRFVFQIDIVPPVVTIINPQSGATLDLNSASTLLARSPDAARAQVRLDNGDWVDVTRLNGGLIFHFFTTPLSPGTHTITLRVWDAAGNMTEVTVQFTVQGQRRGFGFGRFVFPGPTQ